VSAAYLRDRAVSAAPIGSAELPLARGRVEPWYRKPAKAVPRGALTRHSADLTRTIETRACEWCDRVQSLSRRSADVVTAPDGPQCPAVLVDAK